MTERIRRLIQKMKEISDEGVFYERAELLMEAGEKYRNENNGTKYVLSFKYLLENMTVQIDEDELIVGMSKEIILTPEEEKQFSEWSLKNNMKATELFSFDPLGILEITDSDNRFAPEWLCSYGHLVSDWGKLLRKGYGGIKEEAIERLKDLRLSIEQKAFLKNTIIACESMTVFINRYADCATLLSSNAQNEQARNRLDKIAENCCGIAENGARGFYEAIQLIWFTMLVFQVVCGARDYAFGRFDQYIYPYYENDVKKGILTVEQATEIIECLFIKTNEIIGYSWEAYKPKRVLSVNSLQYLMLSGSDIDGNDTTNEISWIVLEAIESLKLKQPTVNIRYHKRIDKAFFERACEITASGLGYPSYFNDEIVIRALENNGVEREKAFEYAFYGCNNSILPGHEDELREAWLCAPKFLEYALNRGSCMLTGKVRGCITPSVNKIKSMDDLYETLRLQIADAVRKTIMCVDHSDKYWIELKPFSFESILMTDCISKVSSMNDKGSLQKHINVHLVGIATVANSMFAIQKLVFEDEKYTLTDLVDLLKNNWKDDEYTRTYAKERYPKFGNDDSRVDSIAKKIADIFVSEVLKASLHRGFGKLCAASADGRFASEDLSENQSPVYGTEQNGLTALLNSVAKLPLEYTPAGGLNVKFQPELFAGESGYANLVGLLEGFFSKGGLQAQINVIERESLIDAQEHPENHKNLLVRVVGYSAYFTSLSPEQQQEIIRRTDLI
jgi:formate C-acetyltransferase